MGAPLLEEFDDLGWQGRWLARSEDTVELLLQLLRRWATEDSHMPRAIQEQSEDRHVAVCLVNGLLGL